MKRTTINAALVAVLMGGLLAVAPTVVLAQAAAATQDVQRPVLTTELIQVNNLSLDSAYTLAFGVCQAAQVQTGDCQNVRILEPESMLVVSAAATVIADVRALLAEADRVPETRAFHIVVLAASDSGRIATGIPQSAQEALADVSDFLPYTGYEILSSGWLRTSSFGEMELPGDASFSAQIHFRPSAGDGAPIHVENFNIHRRIPATYNAAGNMEAQSHNRSILSTTFTISPGETVVVGTSKLNGDDTAVVVLLTAVQN